MSPLLKSSWFTSEYGLQPVQTDLSLPSITAPIEKLLPGAGSIQKALFTLLFAVASSRPRIAELSSSSVSILLAIS